jgi:riboflavin kinase/FMN adenylyltransferase
MPEGCVLTIGNFDGVHRGHAALLRRARARADIGGAPVKVLTFDPHPLHVLRPGEAPPRLIEPAARAPRLRAAGADEVIVHAPTASFLAQTPEQFVDWIVERFSPIALVEGPDFRFGRGRAGDMQRLRELGAAHRFEAIEVAGITTALHDKLTAPIRSSLVRWLIGHGRVADAARCLGRWHALTAEVVRGEQRGRELGCPTANLDHEALAHRAVPASGVYAGTALLPDGREAAAAISVGAKPTFREGRFTIEAHVLGGARELYGERLELRFARWIRDQAYCPTVDSLKAQMERDAAYTRTLWETGLLSAPPGAGPEDADRADARGGAQAVHSA